MPVSLPEALVFPLFKNSNRSLHPRSTPCSPVSQNWTEDPPMGTNCFYLPQYATYTLHWTCRGPAGVLRWAPGRLGWLIYIVLMKHNTGLDKHVLNEWFYEFFPLLILIPGWLLQLFQIRLAFFFFFKNPLLSPVFGPYSVCPNATDMVSWH